MGYQTTARSCFTAVGHHTTASGYASTASGYYTVAQDLETTSLGFFNKITETPNPYSLYFKTQLLLLEMEHLKIVPTLEVLIICSTTI